MLFDVILIYVDVFWCYVDVIWWRFDILWYYLTLCLLHVVIFRIWRGWTASRSPRGRNLNLWIVCLKKLNLQHSSDLGRSTPWSVSSRRCDHTNSHQTPAYVGLFREKSLFSTVYRGATASGTVSRVPGRSTCIGHTKDELRRASDGWVMIIWMVALVIMWLVIMWLTQTNDYCLLAKFAKPPRGVIMCHVISSVIHCSAKVANTQYCCSAFKGSCQY